MQSSQEINWWLEIAKIGIPSLIGLITPFIAYSWLAKKMKDYDHNLSTDLKSYENALSNKLEEYRNNLNKELENYKIQLQSDFQTKLYEFQTKFSLYHQKKADTIETLFGLLANMQTDLHTWVIWDEIVNKPFGTIKKDKTKEEFQKQILINNNLLNETFDNKRIFFDKNIKDQLLKISNNINSVLTNQAHAESLKKQFGENHDLAFRMNQYAQNDVLGIYKLMSELENQFRKLLNGETLTSSIEEKNHE